MPVNRDSRSPAGALWVVHLMFALACVVQAVAGRADSAEASAPAAAPAHPPLAAGHAPLQPPPNPWSDFTRDLLAAHCGRCHRRDLATAVPRALAVFDLLDNPWYGRLQPGQYDEMLVRVRSIENLPAADLETVKRFVGCARDRQCETSHDSAGPAG